jgi:DNA topoisomerase-3
MSDQIVITEKASQARDVRAAVGGRYGAILPAEGHLLALLEPGDVVPEWKRWSAATLLRPEGLYGLKPAHGGNKATKLKAIRDAIRTAKRIWIATDCDREGQLIGQEILEHCRYRGQVMRVMFTAQDPQTIRDAFAKAKPNAEYRNLYAAAVARQQADQIYNLSLTRTATVTLGQGQRAVIGVGRVKTPTMAIVCRRELEIQSFRVQTYYEIVAMAGAAAGQLKLRHAPKEPIFERAQADAIAAKADGYEGPLAVKVEDKRQAPQRLHDLPSLQKLCGSRFAWSAEKTLQVAQELYDGAGKKVITYPRAETRYLAESLIPDVPTIVAGLQAGQTYRAIPVPAQPVIRKGKGGHFWDRGLEGASHHAIIPNVNTVDDLPTIWPRLSADERRLFDIIARAYLAALMPDFRYRQTTAIVDVQGYSFRASGRQPIELGWKAAFRADETHEDDDKQTLPPLRNGEPVKLSDVTVEAKETKPPPRYHEGSLIEAMQNAWQFVEDPVRKERLKDAKGIGTPATRAEIIKGLKHQDLLCSSGKHIVPTEAGLVLFGVLEAADPALVDPAVTAQLELLLDEVLVGQQTITSALDAVCEQAMRIMGRLTSGVQLPSIRATDPASPISPGPTQPPTPAMKRYVLALAGQLGARVPAGYATSAGICRQFLDQHSPTRNKKSENNGAEKKPRQTRSPTRKKSPDRTGRASRKQLRENRGSSDGANGTARSDPSGRHGSLPLHADDVSQTAATALQIPFGNKEIAKKLGARYGGRGWYAPPGVDLSPFHTRGWI